MMKKREQAMEETKAMIEKTIKEQNEKLEKINEQIKTMQIQAALERKKEETANESPQKKKSKTMKK